MPPITMILPDELIERLNDEAIKKKMRVPKLTAEIITLYFTNSDPIAEPVKYTELFQENKRLKDAITEKEWLIMENQRVITSIEGNIKWIREQFEELRSSQLLLEEPKPKRFAWLRRWFSR